MNDKIIHFQNVTDEDSMVVQHILAVRKGTREVSNLNKDDKISPSDSETEIKKEIDETIKEEKSEEKVDEDTDEKVVNEMNESSKEKSDEKLEVKSDEKLEVESDEKPEVKSDETHDEKSDKIKLELDESEKNEENEQNLDDTEDSTKKTVEVDEYYVKYRNFSYLHCEWKTEEELMKGDKRIAAKLKRFKQKMANNTNIFENVS